MRGFEMFFIDVENILDRFTDLGKKQEKREKIFNYNIYIEFFSFKRLYWYTQFKTSKKIKIKTFSELKYLLMILLSSLKLNNYQLKPFSAT